MAGRASSQPTRVREGGARTTPRCSSWAPSRGPRHTRRSADFRGCRIAGDGWRPSGTTCCAERHARSGGGRRARSRTRSSPWTTRRSRAKDC